MLLCWSIGLLALSSDEIAKFDKRFYFRGNQQASPEVILITLVKSEMTGVYSQRTNYQGDYDLITDYTDSFFWNEEIWTKLLSQLLAMNPKAIGVSLYFGDNLGAFKVSPEKLALFQNPKIFWSTSSNHLEDTLLPAFANREQTNIATSEIRRDDDGVVRRVFPPSRDQLHLAEAITGKRFPKTTSGLHINYRGSMEVFTHYSSSEILYDDLSPELFKDKIIIIGAETSTGPLYQTPFGELNRAEIITHIADNLTESRWIERLPYSVYAALFVLLTLLAVFFILTYPQTVALAFLVWLAAVVAAFSAWSFDTFNLWIPAFSPSILFLATWVVFVGYQATRIERQHHRLQQEQQALQELEQLKNNFVSLISHDLKTPIAKIQAIVDRLSRTQQQPEIQTDLISLRLSSEELNKYIQSVLNLLRVESRDFRLHKEVADINEVIELATQQVSPLAQEKNITIEQNLEPMFSLEFDITLIKEVILNVVENAIKYTPANGRVQITSYEEEPWVYVEISDNGEGIRSEDLDKIWGKFTRGSDQDLKTKGTGLGLYLVKYFIELHGGTVSLQSEVGKGTKVSFRLPIENEESTLDSQNTKEPGHV
ncbi:MAG: ATP-binding protein [Bdellovibrionia bacterium]